MITSTFSVRKLDGSYIKVAGSGIVLIRPPGGSQLLAVLPSYYYSSSPQYIFSSNAIKHYLQIPSLCTKHASHLNVTITPAIKIKLPSLSAELETTGLYYFRSSIGTTVTQHCQSITPIVAYSKAPVTTRVLLHQQFGHFSDGVLDTMCRQQMILGLPRIPPPPYEYDCPVCSLDKLPTFHKGKNCIHIYSQAWRIAAYGFHVLGYRFTPYVYSHAHHC
jgi:hypothetical protein